MTLLMVILEIPTGGVPVNTGPKVMKANRSCPHKNQCKNPFFRAKQILADKVSIYNLKLLVGIRNNCRGFTLNNN